MDDSPGDIANSSGSGDSDIYSDTFTSKVVDLESVTMPNTNEKSDSSGEMTTAHEADELKSWTAAQNNTYGKRIKDLEDEQEELDNQVTLLENAYNANVGEHMSSEIEERIAQ
ncbi:hypothetical protein QAD02_013765 [Eretmocerus hayati]|uniref:Uncharacterized protein n=1 Tax=Eretmocerus hayati TaxID=131215 RepID=A0ACC2P3D8_9HYME|nr:hypothetical protein QAD02_013765 [Eretmocerus hayati]